MTKNKKLVQSVGYNDAKTTLIIDKDGNKKRCPFYQKWVGMLDRCYSKTHPTNTIIYADCFVCEEWLTFSNFKSWMEKQDWVGLQLDKDLLTAGNIEYSPDKCIFVSREVNKFLTNKNKANSSGFIGVWHNTERNKYEVTCSSAGKFLGRYHTAEEASEVYQRERKRLAKILASKQNDNRIANAILETVK